MSYRVERVTGEPRMSIRDNNQLIPFLSLGCLLGGLCASPSEAVEAPPTEVAPGSTTDVAPQAVPGPSSPEGVISDRWLDAVRAQRQAWEERRRAAQEAMDARRRLNDPRTSAHEEHMRRREALMEHIERDREHFLNQGPWQIPPPPNPGPPGSPGNPPGSDPTLAYPPLPGWDNRWYYRGF